MNIKQNTVRFLNSKGQWVIENCHDLSSCREHKDKLARTKEVLNSSNPDIEIIETISNPMDAFEIPTKLYFDSEITTSDYKDEVKEFYSLLDAEQASAVLLYSDSGHKRINMGKDGSELHSESLEKALLLAPERPKMVFRAGNEHRPEELEKGSSVAFPAFVSTSYSPQKIFKFISKSEPVIYAINTNKGASISTVHDEMEVLLPKGINFIVENIQKVDFWASYPDSDYHVSSPNVTLITISEV